MTPTDTPPAHDVTQLLDSRLVLSEYGEWIHDGVRFENERLAALFSRSVQWSESEQRFIVRIGQQQATFTHHDTAYFIEELIDDSLPWRVRVSDGTTEPLAVDSLHCGSRSQIYCLVKGRHLARFSRAAHQRLMEHAVDSHHVQMGDQRVKIAEQRS